MSVKFSACHDGPQLLCRSPVPSFKVNTCHLFTNKVQISANESLSKFKSILMSKLYQSHVRIQVSNSINSSQSGYWAILYPQPAAIQREIKPCNEHRAKFPHKLEE